MFEFRMGIHTLEGVLDKAGELHWEAYSVGRMMGYRALYQFSRTKNTTALSMGRGIVIRVITHQRLMLILKRSKKHREIYNTFNNGLMFVKMTATTPVRSIELCSEEDPNAKLFETWINEMKAELMPPFVALKRKHGWAGNNSAASSEAPLISCTLYRKDSPPLPKYPRTSPSPPNHASSSQPGHYAPVSPQYPPPASPPPQDSPLPQDSPPQDSPLPQAYSPPPQDYSPTYTPASPSYIPPRCVPARGTPWPSPQQDSPPQPRRYTSPPPPQASRYLSPPPPPFRRYTLPSSDYTPPARRYTSPARRYTSPEPRSSHRYLAPSPYPAARPEPAASPAPPALGLSLWMDSVPPSRIFIFTGSRVQTFVPQP